MERDLRVVIAGFGPFPGAPSNPSGDPGNGELDLEWSRGSREYFDLRLNLDRTSLGSAGGGVVGQLYQVVYLVGTGRR